MLEPDYDNGEADLSVWQAHAGSESCSLYESSVCAKISATAAQNHGCTEAIGKIRERCRSDLTVKAEYPGAVDHDDLGDRACGRNCTVDERTRLWPSGTDCILYLSMAGAGYPAVYI